MRSGYGHHQAAGRWDGSSLMIVALALLLLVAGAKGGGVPTGGSGDGTGRPFGPLVYSFTTRLSLHQHMTLSSNPLVLFMFDHSGGDMTSFWTLFLPKISKAFEAFGIEVAEAATSSETARELMNALKASSGPIILFFQGVADTPSAGGKALKVPIGYQGKIDIPSVLSWGLSCISSSVTHRLHSDADLARFFALYPKYPALPHVLYFPSANYTPGGYLSVSQHFSSDAVFGVVPNAFAAPEATRIAQRYNITSKDELPALLVLHKASGSDDGGTGESDRVFRLPATSTPFSYREVMAFLSAHITDTFAALVAKATSTKSAHWLEVAESRRLYMLSQLVERQRDIAEEEQVQMAREPILVKDQEAWSKECVRLPKKHRCIAAFIDSAQDPSAKENALKVLSLVSIELLRRMGREALKVSLVVVDRQGSDAVRAYFNVGQSGFPDVLFLSMDHPAKYFNFIGAFTAVGVMQFLASHDAQLAQKAVRGGHAFIPRMVPRLEEVREGCCSDHNDEQEL
ncbi:hypothetical protein LSCM1_00116 [Leishmania martiniquensis]|uniref:Ch36-1190 protein n=1 Tax=Leishmania martiniquensis TaxID=1580590 RepID=A0A836KFS2_9TRYP|nr:hypothetical protein LSCM1_00116 [Leishmania martiniquensis]